jgi:hypothetical protein
MLWLNDELYNLIAFTADGFNFDDFNSGGLHEILAVATWNVGIVSTLT